MPDGGADEHQVVPRLVTPTGCDFLRTLHWTIACQRCFERILLGRTCVLLMERVPTMN